MNFSRINHWFFGHPDLKEVQEEHGFVEDVIAETGHIVMSGWCTKCKGRVYWKEEM